VARLRTTEQQSVLKRHVSHTTVQASGFCCKSFLLFTLRGKFLTVSS